jgi:hypothetical protein
LEQKKVLKRTGWGLAVAGLLLACLLLLFLPSSDDLPTTPGANEIHSEERQEHEAMEQVRREHDEHEERRGTDLHNE